MAPRPLSLASCAGIRRARPRARLLTLIVVVTLAGCGGGETTSHDQAGHLRGTVTRGPTTPVCREGTPCSEPASGARLGFTEDGRPVTIVTVATDGSYSVTLTPGTYVVAALPQPPVGRGLEPSTVRVAAGQTRNVDFQIDTGIR